MPTRAPKGCPICLHIYTGRRCPNCERRRLDASAVRTATKRAAAGEGNPWGIQRWRKASRAYLADVPWCECDDCSRRPVWERPRAVLVDHRDGLGLTGPRAWDPTNWCAMSRACHNRKTNRHDGGLGHPVRRLAVDLDQDDAG
jgi:hypothetical protein